MRIALIHDDFCQLGGAERLFEEIAKIYPNAPIYTSLVNWDKLPESIDQSRIRTSFMQKVPFATKFYKLFLPLYPFAFESFDLSDFDVILSSTTRFSKSVITKPAAVSICYINSVPRFLYHQKENYLSPFLNFLFTPLFKWLKKWDKVSSSRVDYYIANSQNVSKSVKKFYCRESEVIYPFADTEFFNIKRKGIKSSKLKSYYLIVSRLVKWKKIDIAIKACQDLGQKLVIVGTGPDESRLRSIERKDQVQFKSNISKEELRVLYQNAKALVVTQEEDFGISIVEALACGTPVIAFEKGGQTEIIKDKVTGVSFQQQSAASLKGAILTSSRLKWSKSVLRKSTDKFSKENFVKSIKIAVSNLWPIKTII